MIPLILFEDMCDEIVHEPLTYILEIPGFAHNVWDWNSKCVVSPEFISM